MTSSDDFRNGLIKHAVSMGMNESELKRLPVYVIEKLIKDNNCFGSLSKDNKHHGSRKHKRETNPKQLSREIIDSLEYGGGGSDGDGGDNDNDDTRTVVDMEHLTVYTNPTDQKYKRFQQLTKMKYNMQKALDKNNSVLNEYKTKMDADDVLQYQNEIKTLQDNIKLADTQLFEIQKWFNEVYADRLAFYQTMVTKSVDVSGNITDHFQKKILNIQKYMEQMSASSKNIPAKPEL